MNLATLTTFIGWCSVINIGVLLLFVVILYGFHDEIGRLNARIFGVTEGDAKNGLFRIFMQYRLAFAMFNLIPYIALKIIAGAPMDGAGA